MKEHGMINIENNFLIQIEKLRISMDLLLIWISFLKNQIFKQMRNFQQIKISIKFMVKFLGIFLLMKKTIDRSSQRKR